MGKISPDTQGLEIPDLDNLPAFDAEKFSASHAGGAGYSPENPDKVFMGFLAWARKNSGVCFTEYFRNVLKEPCGDGEKGSVEYRQRTVIRDWLRMMRRKQMENATFPCAVYSIVKDRQFHKVSSWTEFEKFAKLDKRGK